MVMKGNLVIPRGRPAKGEKRPRLPRLTFCLPDECYERLEHLSSESGLSKAEILRQLILNAKLEGE